MGKAEKALEERIRERDMRDQQALLERVAADQAALSHTITSLKEAIPLAMRRLEARNFAGGALIEVTPGERIAAWFVYFRLEPLGAKGEGRFYLLSDGRFAYARGEDIDGVMQFRTLSVNKETPLELARELLRGVQEL